MHRLFPGPIVLVALLPAVAACSVVSPPPMRMLDEPVVRPEPGDITLAAAAGGGGGVWVKGFAGAEGRLGVQMTREMAIEASGGGGHVVEAQDIRGAPRWIASGRIGGVYRPARLDWVTLRFGAGGGGADTGLTCVTTDVGASFGWTFRNRVRPYGGVALALSAPIVSGPLVDGSDDDDGDPPRYPRTTVWIGGTLGLAVRVAGRFELGFEGFVNSGWSSAGERDNALVAGGVGVLRYTFGTSRN